MADELYNGLPDNPEQKPVSSSYLLNADAQAILEESPDLETGLELLTETYKSSDWDKPDEAKKVIEDYGQQLRYKFDDKAPYSEDELITLAPIDLTDITGEGEDEYEKTVSRIEKWKAANQEFLATTDEADYIPIRGKLNQSIEEHASRMKREAHGKDQSWLSDKFYRATLGLTGGIAKLVGADGYIRSLEERTDPSRDDDLSSDIASGAGTVAGAIGSGVATGGVGAFAYLGLSGAGEVRDTYETSLEQTGDESRALGAGAIEAGSQALQTAVGGKIFGSAGRAIGARILGRPIEAAVSGAAKQIALKGAAEGLSEGVGGVVSTQARAYGANEEATAEEFGEAFSRSALVGAIFGAGAGGVEIAAKSRATPNPRIDPDTGIIKPLDKNIVGAPVNQEVTQELRDKGTNAIEDIIVTEADPIKDVPGDFITQDGNKYTFTEEGGTARTKVASREAFHPLDKTFFVDKERAAKLAALRDAETPDGQPIHIMTDGENLIIKSEFVDENLELTEAPTGRTITRIGTEAEAAPGLHPVEVNKPRNINGNQRHYNSHIGREIVEVTNPSNGAKESIGAASLFETRERKLAERIRLNENFDQEIREGFGDEEFGYTRYFQKGNVKTSNTVETHIQEVGLENAVRDFLTLPENHASAESVETGRQLIRNFNDAVRRAREDGDVDAIQRLSDTAIHIGEKTASILTNAGQTVQIANLWREFDPETVIQSVRKNLNDAANIEFAKEEGIDVKELKVLPKELAKVEESISQLEKKETRSEVENDTLTELKERQKSLSDRRDRLQRKRKEKLSGLSPEKEKRLQKILDTARRTTGSVQHELLREAFKMRQELGVVEPTLKGRDLLHTMWQLNLLSDPSTQAVNIIGNTFQTLGTTLSYLTTGLPKGNLDGIQFIRGLISGMGEGVDSFISEFQGKKTFRPEASKLVEGKSQSPSLTNFFERPDFVRDAPDWVKKIGLNNLGYVFRLLSATDSFFYKSLQEGQARFLAYNEWQNIKGEKPDLRTYLGDRLKNTTENWNVAESQARSEAEVLADIGRPMSERQVKLRTWEILEEMRPESLRAETHHFASKGTFTNTPEGVVGTIVRGINRITRDAVVNVGGVEIRPLRYMAPFMNTAGNILNANLDYTPVGAFRAFDSNLSDIDRRNSAGKFLLGTMATASIYGFAREFLDDEDPYIAIYANGPKDSNLRSQLTAQGWRPFSIKIGDNYFRYSETPLGIILGSLGGWMDQERWNKGYARQSGLTAVSTILGGMGKAFTDNSFLRSIGDFVKALSGEPGTNVVDSLFVNPARGFVPASGTLRAVTKMISDPIETHNDFWSKFVSGIPFAQSIGTKPALNAFGEPIERTFEDRLSFIGRFYSDRVTDPTWRWIAETGYTLPDVGGYRVEIPTKGKRKGAERAATLGAQFENILTDEERYEFIKRSGPIIKQKVDEYRQRYGVSGYQEKVHERLKKDISEIRSKVKREMFLR